ncbi:MAG: VanW family protein [Bacillota bacterium]|nr:VanW family protein [Bacillota bacterium]
MHYRTLLFLTFFISLTCVTSFFESLERQYLGVKEGVYLEDMIVEGLLEREVRDIVEEIAIRYQKAPVEPRIDKMSGEVVSEQTGRFVEIGSTVEKVMLAQVGETIPIQFHTVLTSHRGAELQSVTKVIGRYGTSIHGTWQRVQNIRVASCSVHNTLLWPGKQFSFNEITGPRTAERGYLPAPIILNGGFDMGLGGGVCQVSSTVYNAVLKAGLPVVERSPHSKPIHYVPVGQDAAVDYGYIDLKFRNNRNQPIIVKSFVGGGQVIVEIWGGEE